MSAETTVVPVKVALTAALKAQLTDVQVEYADPGDTGRRQLVYLGDTIENAEEGVAMRPGGTGRREESYLIDVVVWVMDKPTPETADARAAEIVAGIRTAINADPHLGGACGPGGFVTVAGSRWEGLQSDTGPVTKVNVRVRVKGRTL